MKNKHWKVIRTKVLEASAEEIWEIVGGFYTLHLWHPDIQKTEIYPDQTSNKEIRRNLTFPGQPIATEQLIFMNNQDFYYGYKWFAGPWGEEVKEYHSEIRLVELEIGKKCLMQWTGHFFYTQDALSEFYDNGLNALAKRFNKN
jgi:hypothetical protein